MGQADSSVSMVSLSIVSSDAVICAYFRYLRITTISHSFLSGQQMGHPVHHAQVSAESPLPGFEYCQGRGAGQA